MPGLCHKVHASSLDGKCRSRPETLVGTHCQQPAGWPSSFPRALRTKAETSPRLHPQGCEKGRNKCQRRLAAPSSRAWTDPSAMDGSAHLLINAIVSGLLLGGFYAAVSVGIAISFGLLDIVNLAHPPFLLPGSYVAFLA